VGKPEGTRPFGRPWRRWENNIKMDVQEVEFGGHGPDRTGSGLGLVSGNYDYVNEPSDYIKYGEFRDYLRTGWLLNKDCTAWSVYVYVCICIIPQQNIHKYNTIKRAIIIIIIILIFNSLFVRQLIFLVTLVITSHLNNAVNYMMSN